MHEPFDTMRLPDGPLEPDADFAATLRRRVEAALARPSTRDTTGDPDMTSPHGYIPRHNASINVHLAVHDARAAIEWYATVFGAVTTFEPIVMDDGRVGHVEMAIGDTVIAFADEFPEMGVVGPLARGGATASLMLHVADVDAVFARGVAQGATEERAVADQFHGSRSGTLVDPFGHRWMISTYLGDDGHVAGAGASATPAVAASEPEVGPPPTQAADLWNEVGYYTIEVPELAAAKRFWGGLFGWEFAPDNESPDGGLGAHVTSSVVPFGLHAAPGSAAPATAAGTVHPYFRVRDLDVAVERVRALGGVVESIEQYASGGAATCRDDQGVPFDLWVPADGY